MEAEVCAIASAMASVEAADGVVVRWAANAEMLTWMASVMSLLRALVPENMEDLRAVQRALLSISRTTDPENTPWTPKERMDLVELSDMVDICGQGNRAAPHARDLVRRVFRKSVRQGRFFGRHADDTGAFR